MTAMFTQSLLILTVFLSTVSPAYAYLDPGTGSMIIQMAIAGFLSALFTIKMYWYRIKSVINRMLGREVEPFLSESLLPEDGENKDKHQKKD